MSTSEHRSLAGDDRGVVALSGLAMAVFLTSILYYEIGVGDAITFHEQLQDASDAAGFASAVYLARGMNLIVDLNLVMSAILSIIVVLKVIEAVCGVASAICAVACFFTGGLTCAAVDPLDDAVEWAQNTSTDLDPDVREALQGVNTVATVVAVGMPWVAAIKSVTVGPVYYPQVTSQAGGFTAAVDVSMVPSLNWATSGGSPASIENTRWGLPVQEGEFSDLCGHAATFVPNLIVDAIAVSITHDPNASTPSWLNAVDHVLEDVIGTFPDYFCDAGTVDGEDAEKQEDKNAKTFCDKQSKRFDQCVKAEAPPGDGGAAPPVNLSKDSPCGDGVGGLVDTAKKKDSKNPAFDSDGCESDQKKKNPPGDQIKESALPKAIFQYAKNGNDYMSVWSFSSGQFSNFEKMGISIASWKGVASADTTGVHMLSKAEFFYATEGGSWDDYADEVMWNPRWVARMRRVAPPMIPIGQIASSKISDLIGGAVKKAFAGPTPPATPGAPAPEPTEPGPIETTAEGAITEFLSSVPDEIGGKVDAEISGKLEQAAGYEH